MRRCMAKKQKEAPFIGNWNDTKALKQLAKKPFILPHNTRQTCSKNLWYLENSMSQQKK